MERLPIRHDADEAGKRTVTSAETERVGATPDRSPAWHPILALGLLGGLVAFIVRWVGIYGWDDGAITLAFAKTFAATGRIALTPASETVEGFSSPAWFALNAALARLNPSFEQAIALSQAAAGLFLGAALLFAWLLGRAISLHRDTTLAVLVILALFGPAVAEIANGMEMTLHAASGLALIYAIHARKAGGWIAFAAIVFLASRFEAMVYYAGIVAPLLWERRYRAFVVLVIMGLAIVGLQLALRYAVLGELVPNTIYAKMHPPYTFPGIAGLWNRVRGGMEVVMALLPLVLGTAAALAASPRLRADWRAQLRPPSRIAPWVIRLLAPIVTITLFAFVTGKNWGYTGRMSFLALPCGLLLTGMLFDRLRTDAAAAGQSRARVALVTGPVMIIALSWIQSARPPLGVALQTMGGGQAALDAAIEINPATYRKTGLAAERIRRMAGLKTLVLLTADVGGVGLCCSAIRVVDTGLLTNHQLAHEGLQSFPQLFARERPHVLELHLGWAEALNIYENPAFLASYQPALVNNTRFFVRQDLIAPLIAGGARMCELTEASCLRRATVTHRYRTHVNAQDDAAFLANGRVLIVD